MPAELPNAYGPVEAQVHPLSTRWPKSAAVLAVLALGACAPDQTVSSTPEVQDFASAARNTVDYSSVTLSGQVSLKVGTSTKLSVRTSSRSRGSIKWQSSNPSAATVNSQGNVTGQAVGTAYVTASGFAVNETYLVSVTPAYTLTSFTVSPTTGTALAPGQTRQFSTQQLWSDGQTRNFGVTYTATGGSISSSGLFTAGSVAGSFMVIANCLCGALDTAFVTVEVPAQLTKITVSPKTVSLNAGATQQFGATANWSTGATTLPPITWSATGGSISTSGLYTAPTAAGTYRVIVAHSGGTLRDTATVTVTATTAPPPSDGGGTLPPPSGSASCPNEPAGYQAYGDVTLASLSAPSGFSFWGDNKSIVYDGAAPGSTNVLAWKKAAGTAAGAIGFVATDYFAPRPKAIYSCVFFKRSSNYVEHPSGTKFIYPFVITANGAERPFQVGMLPVDGTTSGRFAWMVEMYSGDTIKRMRSSNVTNTIMTNGKWYRLEFLAISNSPGQQNSVIRWWTSEWNGSSWGPAALNGDYSDVMIAKSGTGAWSSWDYNIYYGGSDGPAVPADQFIYLNKARVSLSGF
jgi:hypothetical protein